MTVETPQPRDRVRWKRTSVIEGVVEETGADGIVVRDGDGYTHLCQVEDATVEVLERADDPSQDLTGSIRHTGTVTCIARERDGGPDYHRWIAVELNESYADEHMRRSRVIGAVPGTPAAEAEAQPRMQQCGCWREDHVPGACPESEPPARLSVRVPNEPHGIPTWIRSQIAEHVVDGRIDAAVGTAQLAGMEPDAAVAYVRDMSEYETYLNHHGGGEKRTRFFKNQYGQTFRVKPDGTSEVLIGATWSPSKRKLATLVTDPYMREVDETEVS